MSQLGRDYVNRTVLREVLKRVSNADLVEVLSDELAVRVPKNASKDFMHADELQILHWYSATTKPGSSVRDLKVLTPGKFYDDHT